MKRSWIGAGLLLFLLAVSLVTAWGMSAVHTPVAQELHRAAAAVDWEQAKTLVSQAEARWKKWQHFRNCFADQTPVEEIDAQFAQLRYTRGGEEFSALAAQTAQMVEGMGNAHALNWWNFF